jgi:hypothetical protein
VKALDAGTNTSTSTRLRCRQASLFGNTSNYSEGYSESRTFRFSSQPTPSLLSTSISWDCESYCPQTGYNQSSRFNMSPKGRTEPRRAPGVRITILVNQCCLTNSSWWELASPSCWYQSTRVGSAVHSKLRRQTRPGKHCMAFVVYHPPLNALRLGRLC